MAVITSNIDISSPLSISSPSPLSSTDDNSRYLPSSLAAEELQLAVNKEVGEDELLKAIERCKELVLGSENCSTERKWLVHHLIELRLRMQEYRDAMSDPQHPLKTKSGVVKRFVKGHHLILQPSLAKTSCYCDHCTGTIWCMIQAWYECKDCGYSCHHKCLSSILRECAHMIISEKGSYEAEICPEVGLSAQSYLCAECGVPLPITDSTWTEAKRCDYSGLYYCSACHWGSCAIIPARVVHNWDLDVYPVAQASLQLLKVSATQPLINLEKTNPRLFAIVHELNLVRRLRKELVAMRRYLLVCRHAVDDHLLWKTLDRPYLIECADLYSLQDLVDTHSGELPNQLHTIIDRFNEHIKVECDVCKGRAHICEVCGNEQGLYPFDANVFVCDKCHCVLHKQCFERKKSQCPKCSRLKERRQKDSVDFT